MGYVQSWNIGLQRELAKDTVVEVRYTGNHGLKEWRQVNINEVNIFENGFLDEFNKANPEAAALYGVKDQKLGRDPNVRTRMAVVAWAKSPFAPSRVFISLKKLRSR